MKLTCPHCSQHLELTPDVLASLQGQPHFACPSCQGLIAVPDAAPQASRPAPRRPQGAVKTNTAAIRTHRGLNRNLLVLGVVALLVLGGIAAFLTSRNGGNIFNVFNNITNQIIHNSYFTQLIASGVTTEKDLEAIAEIRPYGEGFIGISKEALSWEQAKELANRTGAKVLTVNDSAAGTRQELLKWLAESFSAHLSSSVWVREFGDARILDGPEVLAVTAMERQRKVLLNWQPAQSSGRRIPADALAFGSSRYAFIPGTLTWEEARVSAESMGGHLATITSAEEDAWVVRTYRDKISGPRQFWIGGIQEKPDRPWRWVTGEPFAFTQWTTSEPNNAKAPGPKSTPPYMLAYLIQGGRMGWNDLSESDPPWRTLMIGYLVEWDD